MNILATFSLLATLWIGDGVSPPSVWILDEGMSGEACTAAAVDVEPIVTATLSCQLEAESK